MKQHRIAHPALVTGAVIATSLVTCRAELIAYWSFDETDGIIAADTSGSATAHDGTWQDAGGAGLNWEPTGGAIGGAARLDGGANSHEFLTALSSLDGAPGYTFSGWFKRRGGAGGYKGILSSDTVVLKLLSDDSTKTGSYHSISHDGSNGQADVRVDNNNAGTRGGLNNADDEWHHIISTWDGTTGAHKVWLDGVLFDGGNKVSASIISGGSWHIARDRTQNGRTWPGHLDDWGIWNEALSDIQAQEVYQRGLRGCPIIGIDGDTDCDTILDEDEISGALNAYDIDGNLGTPGAPTLVDDFDSDDDGLTDGEEISGSKNPFDASGALVGAGNGGAPTDPNSEDTDGDGFSDSWEVSNQLDPRDDGSTDPNNGPDGDPDLDGLTNIQEFDGVDFYDPTDPQNQDSDGDNLFDGEETSGSLNHFDADGILVGAGNGGASTDPNNPDTDEDDLADDEEVFGILNPFLDGVLDAGFPEADGDPTDPNSDDTDLDFLLDKEEVDNRLDPNDDSLDNSENGDPDGDELINVDEIASGTDPRKADTDEDELNDKEELAAGTNPFIFDTDGDSIGDGAEVKGTLNTAFENAPTDPLDPDSDDDNASDAKEMAASPPSNPNDQESTAAVAPAAYWPMDETSGSEAAEWVDQKNGVATGTPAWTTGQIGGAVSMAGGSSANEWFAVPQMTKLHGSVATTVCGWIQVTSANSGYRGILTTRGEGPTANENWGLNIENNNGNSDNRVPVNGSGGSNGLNSSNNFSSDTWYHIAMVYDPLDPEEVVRIYTDGTPVLKGTESGNGTVASTLTGLDWTIGIDLNSGSRDFDGLMDDMAIFDGPLSAEEIKAIYDAGITGTSIGTLYGIAPPPEDGSFQVTAISYDSDAETVDLTWNSDGGAASYSVISTEDLSIPRENWDVDATGIANAGASTSHQVTGVTSDTRFYAVSEE